MSSENSAVVITSISAPNEVMRAVAKGCAQRQMAFYVIGDVPSPKDFQLQGCRYFGLEAQAGTDLKTAALVPKRHYARKNIGYLLAIREGAETIIETDDDNLPLESFWDERVRQQSVPTSREPGWLNVYRYFSDANIWPRGLPLDAIHQALPDFGSLPTTLADCPIQQGLADGNPDVDAIYRLVLPLPLDFRKDRRVALDKGVWCPFNSQNTTWFRDAFPLLYLPAYCSFRMTDIWRSFVAQRIAWECGWQLLFHEPTVYQSRNDHSLIKDFEDEVPGYLNNRNICEMLGNLSLKTGKKNLSSNLHACYEELVRKGIFEEKELALVDAWIEDMQTMPGVISPKAGAGHA